MSPFDFVVTFQAFIYALALAHVLLAATHMIRHRRELIFDWAHALWMGAALMILWANWISLWDLHALRTLTLPTVATGFLYSMLLYSVCAFVSPKLDGEDGMNMKRFHETQSHTYIGAFVVLLVITLPINYFGATDLSVANWANQNAIVNRDASRRGCAAVHSGALGAGRRADRADCAPRRLHADVLLGTSLTSL
ncbi:MAG: hypothetical protein JO078_09775 [Candidatus Eremiobacteraeota bacterium]|nr:hypothetical protein [Candidatus Eremiobacteraeota bacterium]